MDALDIREYIPLGCLVVDPVSHLPLQDALVSELDQWRYFHFGDRVRLEYRHHDALTFLSPQVQAHLLSSPRLSQYSELLRQGWIQMSFRTGLQTRSREPIRLYVLPDDRYNRQVPRTNRTLLKARLALMKELDLSRSTWQGATDISTCSIPLGISTPPLAPDEDPDGKEQSLLQLFNSINSPDPRPSDVEDINCRDAMFSLLESRIPGLKTTLYPYQRRSAALMLQREVQTRKVIDPRLVKAHDQRGAPYYYDAVAGTCLREPRYYDSPCGGILAEEMGSGKTLICLALVLATKHLPSRIPAAHWDPSPKERRRIGSLADMAAACITRHSVPTLALEKIEQNDFEYAMCLQAIGRNKASYAVPEMVRSKCRRGRGREPPPPTDVYLSHASLIIVPPNLVDQWKQEIAKHTYGLKVVTSDGDKHPCFRQLLECDVVLLSSTKFEKLMSYYRTAPDDMTLLSHREFQEQLSPFARIRFKRCIVDEGHKFGNATLYGKSNLQLGIDTLQVEARWIVTGTPSKGLFGVEASADSVSLGTPSARYEPDGRGGMRMIESSGELEKDDLRRIGSIAQLYLKMRPWANRIFEVGDTPADWAAYVIQPKNSRRSNRQRECLKAVFESTIIRHQLSEISSLLPTVDEKIVYIDGCFQDILVLNLFSAMIIFNAVQSQRTDQDYFFHPRQRKALTELVSNLRQASFFGGSFFSPDGIRKAVDTASEFLREGKVAISVEDDILLREAIGLGKLAAENYIKTAGNLFHDIPVYVRNFPGGVGYAWSVDMKNGDPVCTNSRMIYALQKYLKPVLDAPTSLQRLIDSGSFATEGLVERLKGLELQGSIANTGGQGPTAQTLAGNTQLGADNSSAHNRRAILKASLASEEMSLATENGDIAAPLAMTQLISTASAKLSYLVDQIIKYQADEQIIVFYENDNVAYYLAGVLETLQVQHLIYAKSLSSQRRAQYVATFNLKPQFRVLLMDISQAAFGLDMQSASRIYFINPVLNPQVEAQAIGRARRISQKKPVTVEILVLRGSLEEVILKRKGEMTQEEQRKCHSILDDKPIYEWILNAKILPLPGSGALSGPEQMAKLEVPQFLFGRGFSRVVGHPDQDLVALAGTRAANGKGRAKALKVGRKRRLSVSEDFSGDGVTEVSEPAVKRRPGVRFVGFTDVGESA
ncbi:P-loop containing nucleoside triphosphate hydrolase protein [Podospora appendiculata]|uniref:P-loop containing nucleoside triphosphate hydrolase protein n=1 Tax=Podospora appendiculata TaxID=314037 RepID=A0AAE0XIS0_9PEZI|nr:P-loop containing nucleoside triphosphate hydrolase protein [Podospora appendiculata]